MSGSRERPPGIWRCAVLVVGNLIGSGFFPLSAALAAYGGIDLPGGLLAAAGGWILALLLLGLPVRASLLSGPGWSVSSP